MTIDPSLEADDGQARRDAVDVKRSFIVQAPAGSGKTELLIQRYLRLLATVANPEEVIAITFTRKAAAEMRMRVLLALQQAAHRLRPEEIHLRVTADAAAAVLERDAAKNWGVLKNPHRMRIQTLDSLNASIARMQPLTTTGAGVSSKVADVTEMNDLYRRAAAATLDRLGERGDEAKATHDVLLHIDANTSTYVDYLSRMLRTRDQWLPFVSSGVISTAESEQLRANFENSLRQVVSDRLRGLRASVPLDAAAEFLALAAYAVGNLRTAGNVDNVICGLGEQPDIPQASPDAMPQWHGLSELLLTQKGELRKQVTKNQGFPPGDDGQKKAMHALLESLRDESTFVARLHEVRGLPPVQYTDEQWSVLLSLFRLLPTAVAELRLLFLSRGVTDFIEIALSADDALGSADEPGDVALLLDYQLRHILIDELQDTSKAQYRMLEALTGGWQAGDGRTLFCVGDPMQSIYRFRNAEVSQFLLARKEGIGSLTLEPLVLHRNFRSGERLVDWFNLVFPRVLPQHDDPVNGAVSYSAAVSVDKFKNDGVCQVHPIFCTDVAVEASTACEIVKKTLSAHPQESIAVLLRARTHSPALLSQFRDAGIAYQAVEIDRLTDLPEIIDILALTRAMVHLGDRVAWLALLRSPWVGLDWTDLLTIVHNDKHRSVLELLVDPSRCEKLSKFGQHAVETFNRQLAPHLLADRSQTLHRRVERAWFALGGPALLRDNNAVANVYKYLDVIARLEIGGTLPDVGELTKLLDSEHVSSNESARVQVLTMHKAKGLQFDHVVLYALGRSPGTGRKSVLSWFDLPDRHGLEHKVISPVGRRDEVEQDPIHQFIEATQSAKDKHERGRLLYVACTRARKSLHLIGSVGIKSNGEQYLMPRSTSLLAMLWPMVETDYEKAFQAANRQTIDDGEPWINPELRRFESAWSLPEISALPGMNADVPARDESRTVNYDWVGGEARLAGTIVHRWLQFAAQGLIDIKAEDIENLRHTSMRWLRELGAGEASCDRICDRVLDALRNVVSDEKGRWLLEGEGDAELALAGVIDGKPESIVIDRIRVDSDGTHWIVDYKTSAHEGGDLDGFLRAESTRYQEQLRKYATIYKAYSRATVRCALYFPLLKSFVEVSV